VKIPDSGRGSPRRLRMPTDVLATGYGMSPLPGSKGMLVSLCRGNCVFSIDAFVYDFAADSLRLLVPKAVGAWYSPTGHLLFTGRDGDLFAAAFDPEKMVLGSEPVPVLDGVAPGQFALSASGSILYASNVVTPPAELMWVSRDGSAAPFDSTWKARFDYPAISPDGRSISVSTRDRTTDLWIRRDDGTRRKILASLSGAWRPAWLPDGKSLLFIGVGDPNSNVDVTVWRVGADASTNLGMIFRHPSSVYEAEVTPDTQYLVFRADEAVGSGNIYARRLHGDSTLIPLAANASNQYQLAISPDGKKLAYASTEGGVQQVYVQSFPDGRSKRLVSRGRGYEPRWSRSGKELFFESVGRLMVVSVGAGDDIEIGEPRALFSLAGYRRARNRPQYDIAPGDQKFLMIKDPPPPTTPSVVYVEHWFPELLAKLKH
jgi:eukaryotic-like serine/threonine-protein kinase